MSYSTGSSEPVRVSLSAGSSLIDNAQEITLQAALNHAIGLVADCFDDCNRAAESESVYSQQAKAYEERYAEVDGHQTTLVHTQGLAKNLVHGVARLPQISHGGNPEHRFRCALVGPVVDTVADRSVSRLSLAGRAES